MLSVITNFGRVSQTQRPLPRQFISAAHVARRMQSSDRDGRVSRAEADNRHELPVEIPEPIWSQPFYSPQHGRGIAQEHLDIHPPASRRERCQVARASRQHVHRPVIISAPKMVKSDANLQDALIEPTNLARLSPPQPLQCFVLLEVLAAVELRDPLLQKRRWRFVALTHGSDHVDGRKVVVGFCRHVSRLAPAPASMQDPPPDRGRVIDYFVRSRQPVSRDHFNFEW
jgi:hypothetical protein